MAKLSLSVIIPLYNAKSWITPTVDHIIHALQQTYFDAEIIIIDDGSTDGGGDTARLIKPPANISIMVVSQSNTGRYLARKHGVDLSSKNNILFIDSRVYIHERSLSFLEAQLLQDANQIWNGHVNIDKKGNVFARFWDAVACVAWARYFRRPRTTSFGLQDFDYYPKGTGFFYVPKARLMAAMAHFEKSTSDMRYSSDDTLLIRYLAEQQNIHLSPQFSCLYHGRSTLTTFLKHAYSRGQFFVDGFLRPGTRYFYPLLAVLAASLIAPVVVFFYFMPALVVLGVLALLFPMGLLIGALLFGVVVWDALALAALGIPFAVVYLLGLWRGLARKIAKSANG
ncbi:MAG: glycosyltransferase family A protein [Candidatus Saccharimonadales bacterium]